MKKYISCLLSILCSVSIFTISAAAQTIIEPDYPMHGNKCGTVIIESTIDRDVHVTIVQNSPDGKYKYYDNIIEANSDDKNCEYVIDGKDDVEYTVTIEVPKYKGSLSYQAFTDNIVVYDTDEIADQNVSGYKYTYCVEKNDLDDITSSKTKENIKNGDNIIENSVEVLFPISEYQLGEVNNDNKVNIRDAAALAGSLIKGVLLPEYADFNNDSKINIRDAAAIAKFLVVNK